MRPRLHRRQREKGAWSVILLGSDSIRSGLSGREKWDSGSMARGWESKSVESQIESAEDARRFGKIAEALTRRDRTQAAARESGIVAHARDARLGNVKKSRLSRDAGGSAEASRRQNRDAQVMLRLLCCTILAGSAMAQQFHIDHVTVAGKNVEAMIKALGSVAGITAQYGGPHSNQATEMALASFSDGSYLELIAIQPKADPAALEAHYWHKFLESDGGPCAWAIRPADFTAEVERLRVSKVEVSDPRKSGRKRPDGVQLDWETAQVGPTNGGFFPFLIHDFTPRDNRAVPQRQARDARLDRCRQSRDRCSGFRRRDCAISASLLDGSSHSDKMTPNLARSSLGFRGTPVVLAAPLFGQIMAERPARPFWRSAMRVHSRPAERLLRHGRDRSLNGSDTR